jgi:serine protease Do
LELAGSVQQGGTVKLRGALVVVLAVLLGVSPATGQDPPPPSFATVVEAVAPAVVTIVAAARTAPGPAPEGDDPDPDVDVDGDDARGSGVIVDPTGVVVTNAHIASSAALEVITTDGRRHRPTRVAVDARSNLAVLTIGDGTAAFAAARLGDSDRMRIGDWVVAIGAPLGLETTVTAGVVSARARDSIGPDAPDYLLTSAVLRPGNSGGPLVDVRGEVVGINTVFASELAGIAFTIPSNVARTVVPELVERGRVRRASLGLVTQKLTPELADALDTGRSTGLLVADVFPGGPAAAAGLAPGDLLLSFDGDPLRLRTDLARRLQQARPGQPVTLRVRRRDGGERTVPITLTEEPDSIPTSLMGRRLPRLACEVRGLTPDLGVVVSRVDRPGDGGLRPGDVIRELNHVPVRTVADVVRVTARLRQGDPVAVLVQRGRLAVYVALTAGVAPRQAR